MAATRCAALLVVLLAGQALAATPPTTRADSLYAITPAVDGALIVGGLVGSGVPYLIADDVIDRRCPCNPNEVNGFDRWVIGNHSNAALTLSDISLGLALALPVALDRLDVDSNLTWLEDVTVYVEGLALNGALVSIAKVVFQRPFPRTYAGQDDLASQAGGYRSFYSGHLALTFSALSTTAYTWTARHGGAAWPWVAIVGYGAGVGALMLAAGYHFPTDLLVGAAIGTGLGVLVPALHRRRPAGLALVPTANGIALKGHFY
ncbi:MAG: phosphatase PAP2 family protein [Deltaproteobacteria bacterium]|nr:phosphatase PAP2 family protein [Deltaproteobacteria bacterium]